MGKPVTVKLTSQTTAMQEINDAIKKALRSNNAELNKQARLDLQTQATATNNATALQLVSEQLNGPVTGYQIPTEFELYSPLRQIMQEPNAFPCMNDPFNNEAYSALANAALLQESPPSSPPIDPQFNYVIQRLQYLCLHDQFVSDLKGYQNYSDLYLEDEALADLEKRITADIDSYLTVTDMLQQLTKAWQIQQSQSSSPASAGSPPSQPLLIQPAISQALYNKVRSWLSLTTSDTTIDEITSAYVQALTGPNSTVFPPPSGKTFLENLANLLYGNIRAQLTPKLMNRATIQVPTDQDLSVILGLSSDSKTTVVQTLPLLMNGIDITLFEQLAGVGLQGMLLADIYDYEKSLDFQQSMNSLLGSFTQYNNFSATSNTDGANMAQGLLNAQSAIDAYYSAWELASITVNQNASISGGGNNINARLAATFNGPGTPPMEQYLTYLVSPQGGTVDTSIDLSTNITVQLAGLNYICQTTMVTQPTSDNVTNLVKSISTQVTSDITQMQAAFTSYASSMSSYLSYEELYESNNDVVVAQSEVSGDVNSLINAGTQPKAS